MARLACVNVPALPLQLLLKRQPEWRERPVVVVAEEKAQGRILWVNGKAWRRRIRPGMRYAAALSLMGDLRGGTVPAAEIAAGVEALTARLRRFSPHVEPSAGEPGVFWLDGTGLRLLAPSLADWAGGVRATLIRAGFHATVVAGGNRFAVYAVAKARQGTIVFADGQSERSAAERVPLERLEIEPALRDALRQLDIRAVRDLLRLPATGLLPRFGQAAYRLHRLAAGLAGQPLQPVPERPPFREAVLLDYPESGAARLLPLIEQKLRPLLIALAARQEALASLDLSFRLEGAPPRENGARSRASGVTSGVVFATVTPAAPTRNPLLLLELVRLRLESLRLEGGVVGIELLARGATREVEQLSLFPAGRNLNSAATAAGGGNHNPVAAGGATRDLRAADRALARLRAEFGEGAVVRARPREGHLPEARFTWEPLERLPPPHPAPPENEGRNTVGSNTVGPTGKNSGRKNSAGVGPQRRSPRRRTLVRRFFFRPRPLPDGKETLPGGTETAPGRTPEGEALGRWQGPYILSGGWWGTARRRDYYFAETRRGDLLWLYRDRRRKRWFLQGRVE